MFLTLDPEGVNGLPEIVTVTAHAAAATSITVVRAQQSTVARAHPLATTWAHAVTKADLDDLPHQYFTGKGDSQWGAGPGQSARLAATGTNNLVVVSDTTTATGTKWAAAPIADGSVTTTKIVDGSVTSAKLATAVGGVPIFANAAARDAAIPSPVTGMTCSLVSPGRLFIYNSVGGWRETGVANALGFVRQYRASAGALAITNGTGTFPLAWTTEVVDTDAMAAPPFSTFTLTEGVWAVSATVNLAVSVAASSAYTVTPGGGVAPYSSLLFNGASIGAQQSLVSLQNNGFSTLSAGQSGTFVSGLTTVVPVAATTTLQAAVIVTTAPQIVGTVTQAISGFIQAVQIG
jgi:hypothetical protein